MYVVACKDRYELYISFIRPTISKVALPQYETVCIKKSKKKQSTKKLKIVTFINKTQMLACLLLHNTTNVEQVRIEYFITAKLTSPFTS